MNAKDKALFIQAIESAQHEIHCNARSKGFHDKPRTVGDCTALIMTELGEFMDGFREGNPPDDKIPEFSAMEAELADVVIRCFDTAELRGLRLAKAIIAKMERNTSRERMHGGKVI